MLAFTISGSVAHFLTYQTSNEVMDTSLSIKSSSKKGCVRPSHMLHLEVEVDNAVKAHAKVCEIIDLRSACTKPKSIIEHISLDSEEEYVATPYSQFEPLPKRAPNVDMKFTLNLNVDATLPNAYITDFGACNHYPPPKIELPASLVFEYRTKKTVHEQIVRSRIEVNRASHHVHVEKCAHQQVVQLNRKRKMREWNVDLHESKD